MRCAPDRESVLTRRTGRARGFTLVELMITLVALAVVMIVLMTVIYAAQRSKLSTTNRMESVQAARVAATMMARDLRSAGYGADLSYASPQPSIAYIDSQEVILSGNFDPSPDSVGTGVHGYPLAYNPNTSPQPRPLIGTSWTPPIRYRTGAELVRWTLDVNNDGAVNASYIADANGTEAAATRNPGDYVLVRQVYGDSTGGASGNNGGSMQHVALVQRPGGTTPPLFQVYLRGSATPWNWASGPISAASLSNIERVTVQVTAASSKPDSRGQYATTTLTEQVSSLRNTPNFGAPQYAVDGYVFNDNVTHNGVKDAGEPGLAGVTVRVGPSYTGTTDLNGHYLVGVPAGTYTIRHVVPHGYGVYTAPDSFVVTVPPAVSKSFADTARTGGLVDVHAFDYTDKNGTKGAG